VAALIEGPEVEDCVEKLRMLPERCSTPSRVEKNILRRPKRSHVFRIAECQHEIILPLIKACEVALGVTSEFFNEIRAVLTKRRANS
jgi:hypothetical protein